jgi:acetylornithine deacetylase/succinyl-diaminopimelate desuccinylase-like protein
MLPALLPGLLLAQVAAAQSDGPTRQMAHDVFKELIEINTTDSVGDNTAAARAMAKHFLDAGFPAADVRVLVPDGFPKKGNLVVRLRGRAGSNLKPLLLLGHLDVVEALRTDWTTDPLQLVEKDGYFYGRGTEDMKAEDTGWIVTLIRMRREGFVPARDIVLALTADEESGPANGVEWLLKNHRDLIDAEFALNGDAGSVEADKGKPVTVTIDATEKVYADFQLMVTNPGGHSSRPVPENAIYRLADALKKIQNSPFPFELNPVTRRYFEGIGTPDMKAMLGAPPDMKAMQRVADSNAVYNARLHTTCVATRLNAGHANNALPQTATAVVNCRLMPGHNPEEIRLALAGKIGDPKVAVRYIDNKTGETSEHAPTNGGLPPATLRDDVMNAMKRVTDELWPGARLTVSMQTGASDGKYTMAAGIPTFGVGELPQDLDDDRSHGKDERVRVEAFYQFIDFCYLYLKALLN